ncbi:MAG: bifunctional metallophosphatase/5'-nucleotidase, partial [Bacteroidaceae bacterium]|nr:bifunctional metallophosphatase/5'-nucleotidase [Bacteroidaceae bacterium]
MNKSLFLSLLMSLLTTFNANSQQKVSLRFLCTSDVHGNYLPYDFIAGQPWEGGLSRVATFVQQQRETLGDDAVLLFDNGDILQGQPTSYYYNYMDTVSTHFCAAALNYLRYDVGTIGNHDIETGHPVYDRWTRQCNFPILAANAIDTRTEKPYWKPYTILERKGLRIAVIGMITPAIPQWLAEVLWSGLRFDDMVETAKHWVKVVKETEKPDLIIGLFHSGVGNPDHTGLLNEQATLQVAKNVPGFDLIFCGHDHREFHGDITNVEGRKVCVANTGPNGMNVAIGDIVYNKRKKVCEKVEVSLADIRNITPHTEFVNHFVSQFRIVNRFTHEKIGHFDTGIDTKPAYFGPSAFVDFIHTLQLELSGADVSFAAPLSFDAAIPAGDIHVSEMFRLYRFENMLYVMKLSGKEIKDYLEFSYDGWVNTMKSADDNMLLMKENPKQYTEAWQRLVTPSYNFDSAAGLLYTVDLRKAKGQRVSIKSFADGRPFELDAIYRVALNSYRGNGGGNLLTKGAGIAPDRLKDRIVWSTEKDLRFYMIEAISQHGNVAPKTLNQWKFIPED